MAAGSESKIFSKNPECAFRIVEGRAIIALPKTTATYLLNETAARVWELIDGKRSAGDIAEIIGREFDAENSRIIADVNGILRELGEEGIALREK